MNPERPGNEGNLVKMVTRAPPASQESKENWVFQVRQAGMERGEIRVTVDFQDLQDW